MVSKPPFFLQCLDIWAEYDGDDNLLMEYLYDAESVIARRDPLDGISFYFKDHLGSTRNWQS